MTTLWTRSRRRVCRRGPRRSAGLTLIELIASLAILGVLLAGLLLSKGRLQRQWALADQRLAGIAAADRLLTHWRLAEGVPLNDSGRLEDAGLVWRTTALVDADTEALGAVVVRLEVFGRRGDEPVMLSTVEVLAPMPGWSSETQQESPEMRNGPES